MATSNSADDSEVRILVIGKTGSGKSKTGNSILGYDAFESKVSGRSVSTNTRSNRAVRFGKNLVVCDTPGLFDTEMSEEEIRKEISKWYMYMSPGIHALLLVLKPDRISPEDNYTVEFFMKVFGDNVKDFLIIVFTNKDQLDDESKTLEEYIETIPSSSILQELTNLCRNRCIAIGYFRGGEVERETEVTQILSMIDEIRGPNNDKFYSCEEFKRIEELLREEDERIVMEEENHDTRDTVEYTPRFNRMRQRIIDRVLNDDDLLERMQLVVKGACILAMCYFTGKFVDENGLHIFLIGETKTGKSTTGNTMLGLQVFETKASASSVTSKSQFHTAERFGKKITVVDTPGLLHTELTEQEILGELCKNWPSNSQIDAIILVMQVERFTDENEKTVDCFKKVFGDYFKDLLIVVFTHKNRLESQNTTIEEFVETIDCSSNLRKLIDESGKRFTAIGYRGQIGDRDREVKQILSMVNKVRKNGIKCYLSDLLKRIQMVIEENKRNSKEMKNMDEDEKMIGIRKTMNLLQAITNTNRQVNLFLVIFNKVGNWIVHIGGIIARGLRTLWSYFF